MTAETIVGTQRTFMCGACGATRTARYRQVRRADLICSRCGRSQRHERVTDGPSSDPREQVNAEMSAEAAAILEEIRYLQNIADRLSIEVFGRWHENDAEFLSTVECVDWAGNRRWEARIHPDATLKGQLRAFQAIVETVTNPKSWLGDENEKVRVGGHRWCRRSRQGDLLP